jgi:hypothetical protein
MPSGRRPEKFGAAFRCGFGGKAMPHDIFRDNTRDEKVEQIIASAGLGAAAAHFESAKRMTADDSAGARAIHVNIPGHKLGLYTFNVGGTARRIQR